MLSYNDCAEIRELYDGFSVMDFSRIHSMAQRYEAGKEYKELLIGNYDLYERQRARPRQMTLFDGNFDYEKILKECILSVSYTHLDVYKRQAEYKARSKED